MEQNPSCVHTPHKLQTVGHPGSLCPPKSTVRGQVLSVRHSRFKDRTTEAQGSKNQWMSESSEVPCKHFQTKALAQPHGCFVQEGCIQPFQQSPLASTRVSKEGQAGAVGPREGSESWKGGDKGHGKVSNVWTPKCPGWSPRNLGFCVSSQSRAP